MTTDRERVPRVELNAREKGGVSVAAKNATNYVDALLEPPHCIEMERSVLGAILVNNEHFDRALDLSSESFYLESHRTIFQSIAGLRERGDPADLVTVHQDLIEAGLLREIGGIECLASLLDGIPFQLSAFDHYVARIQQTAQTRRMIRTLAGALEDCHNGVDLNKILQRLQHETKFPSPGIKLAFPLDLAVKASDFLALPIKEREDIVDSILHTQSLAMIVAPRGIGKTRFALHLADAVSRGRKFVAWTVSRPRRCLFVDGELPATDLLDIVRSSCPDPSPLLEVISSEFFYASEKTPLTLNHEGHQVRFIALLEALVAANRRPELIIFDNLSALTFGTEENSNSEQDSLLRFLVELRHLGYAVLVIHHTGKSGEQRGASRREDFLDVCIRLVAPETPSASGNAKFILEFSKMRRRMPNPSSIECELLPGEHGGLVWGWSELDREVESWVECLRVAQSLRPKNQDEIAAVLNIGKSAVSKHLKKSRDKGLLDGLVVTSSGARYLDTVYGDFGGQS